MLYQRTQAHRVIFARKASLGTIKPLGNNVAIVVNRKESNCWNLRIGVGDF